jgi:hypothetical protein
MAAACVVITLWTAVFPTIRTAVRALPATGEVRGAKLNWPGASPVLLGEGHILALSVDLEHAGDVRSPADFQIEFGRERVRIRSLLGYLDRPYAANWVMAVSRPELEPKWGAWEIPLLGLAALATVGGLFVGWSLLATLYTLPIWLLAFFANRELRFGAAWRLAGACLMPGAVIMAVGIFTYGLGVFDLVTLSFLGGAHVVVGWIYLGVSIFFLPRNPSAAPARNPFQSK